MLLTCSRACRTLRKKSVIHLCSTAGSIESARGLAIEAQAIDRRPIHHSRNSITYAKRLKLGSQRLFDNFDKKFSKSTTHQYFTGDKRKEIWRAYTRLKSSCEDEKTALPMISGAGWKVLWQSQISYCSTNPSRLSNLETLLHDMQVASCDTTGYFRILQIEEKAAMGLEIEAVTEWITAPPEPGTVPSAPLLTEADTQQTDLIVSSVPCFEIVLAAKNFRSTWLELGARINAMANRPEYVVAIIKQLYQRFGIFDPNFAVYLIQHLNQSASKENVQSAWSVFNSMIRVYGFKPPFGDFEAIFISFLSVPNVPYAASVLSTMSKTYRKDSQRSTHIFARLLHELLCSCEAMEDIDHLSLHLLEHLPGGEADDKFFDNWLRQSARLGSDNHTAAIIEIMFQKGQSPKPYHIDRLLHAYINFSGPEKARQAESLALFMIQKQLRKASGGRKAHNASEDVDISVVPHRLKKHLPAADARTYVQLMGYYASRGDSETARRVLRFLTHFSSLPLDNRVIRAILSVHFMMKDPQGAWAFFQTVTLKDEFEGCVRTYAVLWKGLQLYLSMNKQRQMLEYPGPRALFHSMLDDLAARHGKLPLPFPERLPQTMYERIVHCFCLAEDTPGALLAIHGMIDIFGTPPTPDTVVTIMKHHAHRRAWQAAVDNQYESFAIKVRDYAPVSADTLELIWQRLQESKSRSSRSRSRPSTASTLSLPRGPPRLQAIEDDDLLLLITAFIKAYARQNGRLRRRLPSAISSACFEMGFDQLPVVHGRMEGLGALVN